MNQVASGHAGSKIIILGEHSVVHGTSALAMGMKKGITVKAYESSESLFMEIPKWDNMVIKCCNQGIKEKAFYNLAQSLGVEKKAGRLVADVSILPGAGLGASASLAVATALALSSFFKIEAGNEQILEASNASEKVYHQNPSGIDTWAVLNKKCILFKKDAYTKNIESPAPDFLIVYSGNTSSTAQMVARFKENLFSVDSLDYLGRMEKIITEGTLALQQGDWETLGEKMNLFQTILSKLGVSTKELEKICELSQKAGAKGAKLTGAGGGGCAIVLAPSNRKQIISTLETHGFRVL